MKLIDHDISFVYVALFGIIVLFYSLKHDWFYTPGDLGISEIRGPGNSELPGLSNMFDGDDRRNLRNATWPYFWNFELSYIAIALFVCAAISMVHGFGITKIPWKWVMASVSIPSLIILLDVILELIRGTEVLMGVWIFLGGSAIIIFATYMMKPKAEQVVEHNAISLDHA